MKKLSLLFALCVISYGQIFSQPIDTLWSENWEGDWIENWYVDGGTWQVGDATSGPDTAYAGSNCAATVLADNYTEWVDSRLVRLTKFTVPSADKNPRLRFWHWFSFSSDDYGYVQIKTEHGNWQNISPQYSSNSSNTWTYPSLDLSAFADSLVQISFYFHSAQTYYSYKWYTYVSSGWYIDNIQLLTGNYTFDSNEGFENGLGDWFADRGTWEVGKPTSGPDTSYMSENCLATLLNGNYNEGMRSRFISPPFKVKPASDNPALRFWHWYSFSTSDFGEVYIKTLNQDWQIISNRFSGTSSGVWTTFYTDLADFADSVVQIAFYFQSDPTYSSYNWYTYVSSGWYIDDLKIGGIPLYEKIIVENDLEVKWLGPESAPLCGTSKEQPISIQIKNNGSYANSNFEVGYSINNGLNYINETVYKTIEPGDSMQYVFRWKADMSVKDIYNCMAKVNVVYDIDDTNDYASATIENDRLIWDIETTATVCGDATGIAEIKNIEGRPGPYKINWTTGATDMRVEKLKSGIYFATVSDGLSCISTKAVTINDVGAPEISEASVINDISCYGMNDGDIGVVPIGGIEPYKFKWSNGSASQNISGLRKGQYDVTITDANGCAKNHSFFINEPAPLKLNSTSTDAVCGELNGSAELIASGGTQPYSFKWNSSISGSSVTGLGGGLNTALVSDSEGCIDFISVSISEVSAPQILVTSIIPASCNKNDGSINISVADETYQYDYIWSDASASQDLTNAPAGKYSVTVSIANESCSSSQIIEIPTKLTPVGEICMISVDSVSNGNLVVLKDPENPADITLTNIYLLGKTGSYQYLNTLNPSLSNSTIDPASNTEITSYRYRITQVDGCGNESEPSVFHETMHVVVSPDFSLNRANLFWNSYKGIEYDFFKIYRYSETTGLEIIDTVPKIINKDFYTFSDLNPPLDDSVQYVIVIELSEACGISKKAGTHNTVRSNKSKKMKLIQGSSSVDNFTSSCKLNIYPNPSKDILNVYMDIVEFQDVFLRIFDSQGKLIHSMQYNKIGGHVEERIMLNNVKAGIYHLQLQMHDEIVSRSFVVE